MGFPNFVRFSAETPFGSDRMMRQYFEVCWEHARAVLKCDAEFVDEHIVRVCSAMLKELSVWTAYERFQILINICEHHHHPPSLVSVIDELEDRARKTASKRTFEELRFFTLWHINFLAKDTH